MKKEIEFDFAKFRQEGISVTKGGSEVYSIHEHKIRGRYYGLLNNGISYTVWEVNEDDLKMFEEVKPREFLVNVYEDGRIILHQDEIIASENIENRLKMSGVKGKTIKVREVFND